MYFGIDFGTTYSTLSIYVDNDKHTGLLAALTDSCGFPTLMRFNSIEGWCYGNDTDIEHYPDDTIKDIKAKIRNGGDIKQKVKTGGREASFEEMLRGYLAWLIEEVLGRAKAADDHIIEDEAIEGITVTVPCGFTGRGLTRSSYGQVIEESVIDAYQKIIRSGVELAKIGRPPVIIMEEPVAAAMDYLHSSKGKEALVDKPELNILVADLGGGTFDVTVVKCKGNDRFQIGTKDGDLHLGGNDFDEALLQLLISKINSQNFGYALNEDKRRLNLLRATKVKERLSEKKLSESASFTDVDGKTVAVTRQEFENATRGLLQRAMALIKRCVDKNGGIEEIDKIVLVGGSCKMPQISNGIKNLYPTFSEHDIVLYNPSYSIANGAAYCAAMNDVMVEDWDDYIGDIATCTYGDLLFYNGKNPHITNMIMKGSRFIDGKIGPKTLTAHASKPNQSAVLFQIFESQEEQIEVTVDENNLEWANGKYVLDDDRFNSTGLEVEVPIPSEYQDRADKYELESKMTLDRNGILTLEIYHDGVFIASNYIKIK